MADTVLGARSTMIAALDWTVVARTLDERGHAVIGPLLTETECHSLASGYDNDAMFRSRVIMKRHGFGSGEYKYYAYPLPETIAALRDALYPPLTDIANRWASELGSAARFPPDLATFLRECQEAGQTRPTPLLLRYGTGDYNCLHQDLYGDLHFPLQVAILLSRPGADFTGGEFVLTEQRPRMQSRADVVTLEQGHGVIFAVNQRPVRGARGPYRVTMRHGVSRLHSGVRHTLGLIFHDAR